MEWKRNDTWGMVFIYKSIAYPKEERASTKNGTKSSIQGVGDGRGKRQSWDRIIVIPAYTLIAHHLLTMLYSKRCLFLLSIFLALGNKSLFPPLYPFLDPEFNISSCCVWGEVSFWHDYPRNKHKCASLCWFVWVLYLADYRHDRLLARWIQV